MDLTNVKAGDLLVAWRPDDPDSHRAPGTDRSAWIPSMDQFHARSLYVTEKLSSGSVRLREGSGFAYGPGDVRPWLPPKLGDMVRVTGPMPGAGQWSVEAMACIGKDLRCRATWSSTNDWVHLDMPVAGTLSGGAFRPCEVAPAAYFAPNRYILTGGNIYMPAAEPTPTPVSDREYDGFCGACGRLRFHGRGCPKKGA